MRELRLSEFETKAHFCQAIGRYHKATEKQLLNLHASLSRYASDIVVRFRIGEIEIVIEHDVEKKGTV